MRNILIGALASVALALPAAAKSSTKADAQVTCKDGTTSKAGRGACSHHGGIADANATVTPDKSDRAPSSSTSTRSDKNDAKNTNSGSVLGGLFGGSKSSAQGRSAPETPRSNTTAKSGTPTARCKDGSMSYSAHRSGTCSRHGGVAEWMSMPAK